MRNSGLIWLEIALPYEISKKFFQTSFYLILFIKTTCYNITGIHYYLLCSYIQMIHNSFVHTIFTRPEK